MAWLGTWANRYHFNIAASDVDANLTNFPVHLKLSTSSGKTNIDLSAIFDELGSNELKIAITTSDGTTQCYVEVADWDSTSELAELHFKAPSLSSSGDNMFYIYYDNAQSDNTTYVGVVGSTPGQTVWDGSFEAVYHFTETTGDYLDSTTNGNDSTTVTVSSRTSTGVVSRNTPLFSGSAGSSEITVPNHTSLQLVDMTLEAFVCNDAFSATFSTILTFDPSDVNWYGLWEDDVDEVFHFRWSTGTVRRTDFLTAINTSTWYHVAGTLDDGTSTAKTYQDGQLDRTVTSANSPTASTGVLSIGHNSAISDEQWEGQIDEIRLSSEPRDIEWLAATNKTLRDTFITFSTSAGWSAGKVNSITGGINLGKVNSVVVENISKVNQT